MPQVKFVIDDQLLKKFKQIVIRKRGKIELTPEGEDAIRLYVEKYRGLIEERSRESEPLADTTGALNTRRTRSALDDLKQKCSARARSLPLVTHRDRGPNAKM